MMRFPKHKSCQLGTILLVSSLLCGTPAHAESPEDFVSMTESLLSQEADKSLRNQSILVAPIKNSKPDCTHQPYIARSSQNSIGKVAVVISCQNPKWQQFMSAQVDGEMPVIVTKADIAANTPLTANMMTQTWVPANTLRPNYYTHINQANNKTASRFIRANTILADNMLKNTQLIQKDQEVTVIMQQGGLRIELRAVALESGEVNKLIRLKNISSGNTLQGRVVSADTVTVE